jgi:hypothetical protein
VAGLGWGLPLDIGRDYARPGVVSIWRSHTSTAVGAAAAVGEWRLSPRLRSMVLNLDWDSLQGVIYKVAAISVISAGKCIPEMIVCPSVAY